MKNKAIIFLIMLTSCTLEKNNLIIEGEISEAKNSKIYLSITEQKKIIDSASIINGKFILEIGFDQRNKVVKILNKEGFYINKIQKDLAGNDRCIVCTKI